MKTIKYILLFTFMLILLGILGKSTTFPGAEAILFFGILLHLLIGSTYGIISLIKRKHRIEGGMISLASPLILGILFKIMYWPGAGFLVIVGSSILLLGSIGVLIYTITNKRNISLGVLYFAIGLSGLFFCFKFMRWPDASFLIIPASISIVVALIVLIKDQVKMEISKIVSLIVIFLAIILFTTSDSKLYSFRHINSTIPELNYPEHYYTYSWILYKEGDIDQAKTNLELAIQEAKNPYNTQQKNLDPKLTIERYEKAMDLLILNKWNNYESY